MYEKWICIFCVSRTQESDDLNQGYTELLAAGAVGPLMKPRLTSEHYPFECWTYVYPGIWFSDVSRIEAGRLRLDFKPLSIFESADEVVRSLRRQIDEKQQQLKMELPENLPQYGQIEHVLTRFWLTWLIMPVNILR